jgi:hypothetical protein
MSVTFEQLKQFIHACNDPKLINTQLSPLENTIYHIYSDGEITEQKGSWAYGQRNERTWSYPKFDNLYQKGLFPYERKSDFGTFGYAIVTKENAEKIIEMMKKYVSK